MATLVLSTVGGAIGGPIGSMVGSMVGQFIDRELLFKPKGREGPRLNELKVQTSSYGTPIPKLFGTLRVAGSVIWATDLVEHRHREGGKGRPTVTSYSYTASFAVALSARPVLSVGRIWADGKLLRGAAGDWKVRTGFRLHTGGEDQMADPLIASAEGTGLAPAHRGIAYAVFEDLELADYGNRIPSLSFEIVADPGAVTADAIVEAVSDGRVAGSDVLVPIEGFSAYGGSQRGVIEPLAEAAGAWPILAGGVRLLRGAGAATEVADIGTGPGLPGDRAITTADRTPQRVTLSHYDPARDYQAGVQTATRPGAGYREAEIQLPAALSAAAAKQLAEAALARADQQRERRMVRAGWNAFGIAPGARVRIAGEPGQWRVADWSLEAMAVKLALVRIASAPLPARATPGRVLPAPDEVAGATILHAFELPHLDEGVLAAPRLTIAACGTGAGWRRAALAVSVDGGMRWEPAGATAAPAIAGTVEDPGGATDCGIVDRRNSIVVELAHGAMMLTDADDAALDAGLNLALIGDELIQFGEAEPLGGNRWQLSRLWRGRRATEAAAGAAVAGDRFVLIDPVALAARDGIAGIGAEVAILGTAPADGEGVEITTRLTGASILPPAPVHLRIEGAPGGSPWLRWTRRSRSGWRWQDGVEVPVGEETERYRVRIVPSVGDELTETSAAAELPLPAGLAGPLLIEVRQIGDHGLSPPAFLTI